MKKSKTISAQEFDARFESGQDMSSYVDWSKSSRPGLIGTRVNVDFPKWVVDALDRESARLGITRQALIKVWTVECLEKKAA